MGDFYRQAQGFEPLTCVKIYQIIMHINFGFDFVKNI